MNRPQPESTQPGDIGRAPAYLRSARWRRLLWTAVLAGTLALMIRADLGHLHVVSEWSSQGAPPPAREPASPTGYVLGQRHFLGTHERGETYRWIEATQDLLARGPFASHDYQNDTVPTGRPQLLPRIYTAWLAAVAGSVHLATGEPVAIAAERAALWEPVLLHALAFVAVALLAGRRFGLAGAAGAGLFFVICPPLFGQFLPGVLTPKTAALLLAAYALAQLLPAPGDARAPRGGSTRAAIASAFSLGLDPACGFPVVLISAATVTVAVFHDRAAFPFLRWSLVGSALTLAFWLIDQAPWSPAAGELRYVHPLYAAAWLGLGLTLDAVQRFRVHRRKWHLAVIAAGLLLFTPLVYTQLTHDYLDWLYPSVWVRRITSLHETAVYDTAAAWIGAGSVGETMLVLFPLLAAIGGVVVAGLIRRGAANPAALSAAVLFLALLALAFFRIRWLAVAMLVAVPLIGILIVEVSRHRRLLAALAVLHLGGLVVWHQNLPPHFQRLSGKFAPQPDDLEALLYRHFSQWLASHSPGQKLAVLAPPELSDSVVFHGGGRVLMSTAWESHPGQIAATRVLSAPESTEAEAVIQSRELTHLVLPDWDTVLPLFVQNPNEEGKDTLYARLQRWVYPAYLRPIPYQLPPIPGFEARKLAVFKVTPPQDEGLQLSRLAEYFVEMGRTEPASLVAQVLRRAYADDPNAIVARALVYAHAKQRSDFDRELSQLVAGVNAGRSPVLWDRRVQRAIVLALGRHRELARAELAVCLETVTESDLCELTPLQAFHLRTLTDRFGLPLPSEHLTQVLAALGAEFSSTAATAPR